MFGIAGDMQYYMICQGNEDGRGANIMLIPFQRWHIVSMLSTIYPHMLYLTE